MTTRSSDPAPATRSAEDPAGHVGTLVLDRPATAADSPASTTPHAESPAQTPERGRRRYHEVDLLRFVAAIAVVLYHYLFRASVEIRSSPPLASPIRAASSGTATSA